MVYAILGTTVGAQTFRDSVSNAITANFVKGAGTATGTIVINSIGLTGVPSSGSSTGSGISAGTGGTVVRTVTIDSNVVFGVAGFAGIDVVSNGASAMNANITNNITTLFSGTGPFAALNTISGGGLTDTASMCLHILDNTLDVSDGGFAFADVFTD